MAELTWCSQCGQRFVHPNQYRYTPKRFYQDGGATDRYVCRDQRSCAQRAAGWSVDPWERYARQKGYRT